MSANLAITNQIDSRAAQPPRLSSRRVAMKLTILSIVALVISLIALDRLVMPVLEDRGLIVSRAWRLDNMRIWKQMSLRNQATDDCPVWSSLLLPVSREKKKGKRILVLGDSFVWGDGYTNVNTIWWRQLSMLLEDEGYRDVEVIAAGKCGYQTQEQLRWLKRGISEYNPDLVIWGYVTNDPQEKGGWKGCPQIHNLPETGLLKAIKDWGYVFLPNLTDTMFSMRNSNRRRVHSGENNRFEYGEFELKILEGENFERYMRRIEEVSRFQKQTQIPMLVMPLPNGFTMPTVRESDPVRGRDFFDSVRDYYRIRYDRVRPLFQQAGLLWVDTLEEFIAGARADPYISASKSPLRLGINPANGHPGPYATRFYARQALSALLKHHPQCLGPRTKPEKPTAEFNDCLPASIKLKKTSDFSYEFAYPQRADEMLEMPMRKKHIQLSFARPVSVSGLRLEGPSLKECTIYATYQDDTTGYDPQVPEKLCRTTGDRCRLEVDAARHMCTIEIAAQFKDGNRELKLVVIPGHHR